MAHMGVSQHLGEVEDPWKMQHVARGSGVPFELEIKYYWAVLKIMGPFWS